MLEIRGIHKSYEQEPLLRGVSFKIVKNETVCLLGPSGSGKSTLLQIIAGLEPAESGSVLWDGQDLSAISPHLRDFGLVFQDYALFPHLNVQENIAFGPAMKGWVESRIHERVAQVLDLVNLHGFEHRTVTSLSGGEQQRVALARALAPQPRFIMFDEPLGALDRTLRDELLDEIRLVLARTHIPSLYVTHDQDEAFRIGDRILLLHSGRILRDGTPQALASEPGSAWAAEFLGLGNIIPGTMLSGRRIQTVHGTFALTCHHRHAPGDRVHVLARPAPAPRGALFRGTVRDVIYGQQGYRVTLDNGLRLDMPTAPRSRSRLAIRLRLECLGSDSEETL